MSVAYLNIRPASRFLNMSIGSSILGKPRDWRLEGADVKIGLPKPFDILSFTLTFRRKHGRTPTPEEISKARAKHLLRKNSPQRKKTKQIIQVGNKQIIIR